MKKIKLRNPLVKLIMICLFFINSSISFANNNTACNNLFSSKISENILLQNNWRPTPSNDLFVNYRANAPHFWNWISFQNASLLNYQGSVIGDPHLLNFGAIYTKNKTIKFGFIDADDFSMKAPFVGDIIRLLNGAQASGLELKPNDILNSYLDGLLKNKKDQPEFLAEWQQEASEIYNKKQDSLVDKNTTWNRFATDSIAQAISFTDPKVQTEFEKMKFTFEARLAGYRILDVGAYLKSTGGSQGMIRFWYLVESNGERSIIEFKQITKPASSIDELELSNWITRFKIYRQLFHTDSLTFGMFDAISANGSDYLVLLKEKPMIQFDPAELDNQKDVKKAQQWTLYMARKLGFSHGQQTEASSLKVALTNNPLLFNEILFLSELYYSKMIFEINKH